jgi:TRAP-type transport system large permease protein
MSVIAISLFLVFGILGMPLAFAMAAGVLTAMHSHGLSPEFMVTRMVYAVDSFPLMAIPLFAIAGQLLAKGGVIDPLIDFANALVGRVRGGLGHVTVISAMSLSAVSGTAVADAAALGAILGPSLSKNYSKGFGAALVSASACMGPIIPPSAAMIVYAVVASDVSVAGLFLAGFIPGLLMGIGMMLLTSFITYKRGWPLTGDPFSLARVLITFKQAWLILFMPIVVVGGIVAGIFTATEGAAIGVAYSAIAGLFITKRLKLADFPSVLFSAALITAVVGVLIAFSSSMTFLFTLERLGIAVAAFLQSITDSQMVFILLTMGLLLILGMFVEGNSLIIMLAPIFAPVAVAFGVDPVYFGFLFVMNVALGSLTPPVGILLFVTSSIWKVSLGEIVRHAWPYMVLLYGVLLMLVVFPDLVMWLPRVFGYAR